MEGLMAYPITSYFPATADPLVDGMTNGYYWYLDSSRTVDYSISNGFSGEYWISPSNVATYMGEALDIISIYANIKFNYVGSYLDPIYAAYYGSEINLSLSQTGILFTSDDVWAEGFFPDSRYNTYYYSGAPGDIYLNISSAGNFLLSYEPGSQGWFLLMHELLHTLGLKHPHDDGGTGRPTFSDIGISSLNIDWATVMSYNDGSSWNNFSWDPATPMALDVLALQYIYGKNTSYNRGDDSYSLLETAFYYTLWDAGGSDTLNASAASKGWTIFLPNSSLSSLVDTKVGYAAPTSELLSGNTSHTLVWLTGDYENVVGSRSDDVIYGNLFDNVIGGGNGNDTLFGDDGADTFDWDPTLRSGSDIMYGGAGNDVYVVNDAGDVIIEYANEGVDTIWADLSFSLASTGNIEKIFLIDSGNFSATGNALANYISGNSGNNTLDGGAGDDTLIGGAGDDIYIVDGTTDTIIELSGGGTDTVQSSITFSLAALAHVEHLTLTGTGKTNATGNSGNNILTGNSGNNTLDGEAGIDMLIGGAGNDTLYGNSGDTLIGGAGDDTYYVSSSVTMNERFNQGIDTIISSVNTTLAFLTNHENLTLIGSNNLWGTGNALNNILTGNSGNNTLDGGAGNDTISGGLGNDTLDGGFGNNTAIYSGIQNQYAVTHNFGVDTYEIVDAILNRDGIDTLSNVNRLQFFDAMVSLDIAAGENSGSAYRLYQAAFSRTPDAGGLGYWINALDHGAALIDVANGFIGSSEFASLYGANPTDGQFIAALYNNVLHRAPDSGGATYWEGVLANGTSRANVLIGFSESSENISQVAPAIEEGVHYHRYVALTTPNTTFELTASNVQIAGTSGLDTVSLSQTASAYEIVILSNNVAIADGVGTNNLYDIERLQFADTMVALDIGVNQNAGKAYMLYQAAFNRTPDTGGLGFWIDALDHGANINDVAQAFINSSEFTNLYGANPSASTFVNGLYQNVLDRAADSGGLAYWEDLLNNHALSQAQVLESFASSSENVTNVTPDIRTGIHYDLWGG
jgi:Ca2+-binding RTX toxin-like protein